MNLKWIVLGLGYFPDKRRRESLYFLGILMPPKILQLTGRSSYKIYYTQKELPGIKNFLKKHRFMVNEYLKILSGH
jgi:hypothetical protein